MSLDLTPSRHRVDRAGDGCDGTLGSSPGLGPRRWEEIDPTLGPNEAANGCRPHVPIRIYEDEMFKLGPAVGVVNPWASESAKDPYRIEGWCIQPVPAEAELTGIESLGIYLSGTSAHVVISDNLVNGHPRGPEAIEEKETGIEISHSAHVTVKNNTVTNQDAHGVVAVSARAVTIEQNNVTRVPTAIKIYNTHRVQVHENNLERLSTAGLLTNATDETIDARNNWWGSPSGPSGGEPGACTGTIADGFGWPVWTRDDGQVCFDPSRSSPIEDAGATK